MDGSKPAALAEALTFAVDTGMLLIGEHAALIQSFHHTLMRGPYLPHNTSLLSPAYHSARLI